MIVVFAKCGALLLLGLALGCAGTPSGEPEADAAILGIEEASGVSRVGPRLYIVGDHEAGTFYSLEVGDDDAGRIALSPERLRRHHVAAGRYAIDLEAIDALADGRIVILSERLSALLDDRGFVAIYGADLAEFGGRGCEGMSIRGLPDGSSRVAVLWEGGYPEAGSLPRSIREHVCRVATQPTVLVHDLEPDAENRRIRAADARQIGLQVPLPEGAEPQAQRFRTPDLVWHRLDAADPDSWGFIVLMSSGWGLEPVTGSIEECGKTLNGLPLRWCYKWLQRFTLDGEPYGAPFDLDGVFPDALTHVNWEGMGWFVPGESLVLVYDERVARKAVDPQEAIVVPLPEGW